MRTVKQQVVELVKAKLIEVYGGLSTDEQGNEIDTPYTMLGILNDAIPDDFIESTLIYHGKK